MPSALEICRRAAMMPIAGIAGIAEQAGIPARLLRPMATM
jgi:hypothetical protein